MFKILKQEYTDKMSANACSEDASQEGKPPLREQNRKLIHRRRSGSRAVS